jgi:hypothetical protein
MIEVFGPTYRYQGEQLTTPEIVVVNDHHYNDQDHCYHVEQLLANSTCDPSQHILVMDHVNHEDELEKYHCLCLPIFVAESCEEFKNQNITVNWANKTHAFNFMINKPRPHREFLMMLIEHFDLTNYTHTLPWQSINLNKQSFKQITNNTQYQQIIDQSNVSIPMTNYHFGPETTLEHGILNGSYKNSETYQHLLQKTVFEPACVSLITEPAFYERETIHTEKTVMAIYGGTFPIWVGGWGLADWMKSLGFDVFDDIIDHSYQYMSDPLDRCYHAVKLNLELLQNFDLVHELLQKNQSRLEHNLTLLKQNVFLTDCINKVKQYPDNVQSVLYSVIPKYRGNTAGPYRSLPGYRLLGSPNTREKQ